MIVYHGTREGTLPYILRKGLKPRGKRVGNWQNTVNSNPDAVYLTTAYPMHFAQAAVKGAKARVLILEIDTEILFEDRLAPDEDFLEQATRTHPDFQHMQGDDWSMTKRTKWFRQRALSDYGFAWDQSLKGLGTCSYYGVIAPWAITRYLLMSPTHPLAFMSDPTISVMNYNIMGAFYRSYTRYLFGDEPLKEDNNHPITEGYMERVRAISREGIDVVDVTYGLLDKVKTSSEPAALLKLKTA